MTQYRQFIKSQEVDEVIVCLLCKDSWDRPIELGPCGHIFCESCISEYWCRSVGSSCLPGSERPVTLVCPNCSCAVEQSERPNRVLVNKALEVQVRCTRCNWNGTREQSQNHTCRPLPPSEKMEVPVSTNNTSESDEHRSRLSSHSGGMHLSPEARNKSRANNGFAYQHVSSNDKKWKKYGLTQIEYDQIVSLFMAFDTENKGFLTRSQLRQLAFSLNYVNRDEHVDRMLFEMGCDETGGLMIQDLCAWLGKHRPNPQALCGLSRFEYNEALLQFRGYDLEGRGFLDWKDFRNLCLSNGYAKTEAEAQKFFCSFARTSKNYINLCEFLLFCKHRQFLHGEGTAEAMAPGSRPQRLPHRFPGAAAAEIATPFSTKYKKKQYCMLM
ncbi:EF hand [Trypanosoma cruzi cruzi]|nr:EF hand [Trypanosoma cruzi cruzi]